MRKINGTAYHDYCIMAAEEVRKACMNGGEFPDEVWRVARKYHLEPHHVEEMYDREDGQD
jgi:hypothetical protein